MPAPIITPGGPLAVDGKTSQVFTADQSVTWTTSGGTLSEITTASAKWTAPNVTGTYTVTATNGASETDVVTVTVKGVQPRTWDWKIPVEITRKALMWEPDDGPSQTRSKSAFRYKYEMGSADISYEEFIETRDFFMNHHPSKKFYLDDPAINRKTLFETDSDFKFSANSADSFSWSYRVKEAYPYGSG